MISTFKCWKFIERSIYFSLNLIKYNQLSHNDESLSEYKVREFFLLTMVDAVRFSFVTSASRHYLYLFISIFTTSKGLYAILSFPNIFTFLFIKSILKTYIPHSKIVSQPFHWQGHAAKSPNFTCLAAKIVGNVVELLCHLYGSLPKTTPSP